MAYEKHLEIIKQGVEAWNRWRKENTEGWVDLSDADLVGSTLRRVNLRGANLSDANLREAYFSDANLSDARLIGANLNYAHFNAANLSGADLSGANLNHIDLIRADLSGANLSGADLGGAYLWRANLSDAKLQNADFTGAEFRRTIIADTDLSMAKGLDSVRHIGPSEISISTLYKSGGNIPEAFLRGCGAPDTFIAFARSLVNAAIDFYSCFISYSSKNHDFAERLHADLQSKGVRCWFAPEDLKIGEKIRVGIDESIRLHDKLLLVLSKYSVESEWVEKEVETAMEQERHQKRTVLFPVMLDNSVLKIESGWPADIRRTRHIGDFTGWKNHDSYQKAFTRLLRDLKAESKT